MRPPHRLDKPRHRRLGVAHQAEGGRIAAAQFLRIDVDLHDRGAGGRNPPGVGQQIAGVAADEQHHVGAMDDAVGGRRRIEPRHADGQRMPRRHQAARAERGRHRSRQRLGQRQHLAPGTGGQRAFAGHDRHPLGRAQPAGGPLDLVIGRHRAMRRHLHRRRTDLGRFVDGSGLDDFRLHPEQVEMRRARRAGCRRPDRLAQQPRQLGGGVDLDVELGHRRVQRQVGDFLVGVAVLQRGLLAAGQRYHRAARQPRVLQACRQIGRPHRLREAEHRPAGHPRMAVGHVGHGFFRMSQHPLDTQPLQRNQRPPQHRIHEEEMRGAGRGDRPRQPVRSCCHLRTLHPSSRRAPDDARCRRSIRSIMAMRLK